VYKNSYFSSYSTIYVSATKTNPLFLFMEASLFAVKSNKRHVNAQCGQKCVATDGKVDVTCSHRWAF
jgi:hypothetical protein